MKKQRIHRALTAALLGLLASTSACLSQSPPPQYPEGLNFATVYSHDSDEKTQSEPIPQRSQEALDQSLIERQLTAENLSFERLDGSFTQLRDTDERLKYLKTQLKDEQFLLLVEVAPQFYSVLSGRYRWDVYVKLALYDSETGSLKRDQFRVPTALLHAHERGPEAIVAAQGEIQKRILGLVDRYLRAREHSEDWKLAQLRKAEAAAAKAEAEAEQRAAEASQHFDNARKINAIYFVLLDRFHNGDGSNDFAVDTSSPTAWHGGDFAGLEAKLPYLKALGVDTLWLSPFFDAAEENFFGNAAFHGYWTYDLQKIQRHFGDQEAFLSLTKAAQAEGLGLIIDFVANHVGYGSPLIQEKPDWFHPALTIEDWDEPTQLLERQVHGLPDLNQDQPEVYDYLLDSAKQWLAQPNVLGFRLDAVKHVSLDFWQRFNRTLIAQKKDLLLLGEYFDGDPKRFNQVWKNGAFTHLFDFPLAFALRNDLCGSRDGFAEIASVLSLDRLNHRSANLVTFVDNHDMPRLASICQKNERDPSLVLDFFLLMRGIPSLYYGTETPLYGVEEPANRGDMVFETPQYFDKIRQALAWRKQFPVLAEGKTGILHFDQDSILIGRELGKQQALIVYSRAQSAYTSLPLPAGQWYSPQTQEEHSGVLPLKAGSVQFLIRDEAAKPILDSSPQTIRFEASPQLAGARIVGSCPELGLWRPEAAPVLNAEGKVSIDLPKQSVAQYKIVRQLPDGSFEWHDGDNQVLFVSGEKTVLLSW